MLYVILEEKLKGSLKGLRIRPRSECLCSLTWLQHLPYACLCCRRRARARACVCIYCVDVNTGRNHRRTLNYTVYQSVTVTIYCSIYCCLIIYWCRNQPNPGQLRGCWGNDVSLEQPIAALSISSRTAGGFFIPVWSAVIGILLTSRPPTGNGSAWLSADMEVHAQSIRPYSCSFPQSVWCDWMIHLQTKSLSWRAADQPERW